MLHRLGRCVPEDGGRESDCLDGDWQEVREEEEEGREEIGTSESRWPTDCSGCIVEEESPPAPSGGEQNAVLYSSQASPSSASSRAQLLEPEPDRRATAVDALRHAWLCGGEVLPVSDGTPRSRAASHVWQRPSVVKSALSMALGRQTVGHT